MTELGGSVEAMPPGPATPHVEHDPLLVAAFAAGDAGDAAAGAALVASCSDCRALRRDLVALAEATRVLPPPVRTRGFRLSPEQARAHRPQWWRGLLAPFASSTGRARPVGALLVTIGLAGLFVGLLPGTPGETLQNIGQGIDVGGLSKPAEAQPSPAAAGAGGPTSPAASSGVLSAASPEVLATPCASPDIVLGVLGCQAGGGDTAVAATPSAERQDAASRLARDDRPIIALSLAALATGLALLGSVALARRLHVEGGG